MELLHTVTREEEGKTVKEIAHGLDISATLLKRFKFHGTITCNGVGVTVKEQVHQNDRLRFFFEETSKPVKPFPYPTVLYEDEWIIALDKPAGLATHPAPKSGPSLAEETIAYLGGGVFRAVGRLDKITSGVVLAAKDPRTAYLLGEQMKQGGFIKEYHALTCGVPPPNGEIVAPIKTVAGEAKRIIDDSGQYAKTHFETLAWNDRYAIVKACPITGRTHQIRVHLAHIGYPLYGDPIYAEEKDGVRPYLRCVSLTFIHPVKGKMTIKANLEGECLP